MLASTLANELGEGVIRAQLDNLKQQVPLDSPAKVTNEPCEEYSRWCWQGLLYREDKMSVRVSLGCQGDDIVRAKVRAYYDKAFASTARMPPGERNRQEIYTGKPQKFKVDNNSKATFSTWLKDQLADCTAALRRQT